MKAMKKALALGLALAMVVTAVPVTNAQAATTGLPTKKTYAAGKSYTLKLTTPSSWKSVKTTWSSSKKSVAKLSSKKAKSVKVTAVKKGTSTVKAKVTFKKASKSYKKTYTCKVTVKEPSLTAAEATTVAVGSKVDVKATQSWPTTATVTYSSDKTDIATVDEATGEVTGVKAGEAVITTTLVCGTKTLTATTKVTVKDVVLQEVKQTKADTFEATIAGKSSGIKPADITFKNSESGLVYPVKSVSVDSKDATKVTLTAFNKITDGKTYDVTLDGTTKQVVVTDGKIASVGIDKLTIAYATETEIKLVSKDVNGIIIDEYAYGKQDTSKYDFSLSTSNGYVNGTNLYLNKVGDTATAEVTYKTGKYGADGKPEGNITSGKLTITAVDQAAVSNYDVKIAKAGKTFDKIAANKQIAVGETSANMAYFQIKNADNKEIAYYTGYTVESSDNSVLMVDSADISDKKAQLTPVKAGTAYLLIKKDGSIVGSVVITVVAAKAVTTIDLSTTSVTLSTALGNKGNVTASFKDQYSAGIKGDVKNVAVTCLSTSADKVKADDVTNNSGKAYWSKAQNVNDVTVTFETDVTKGTYVYKIAYMKDGKEVCAKVVNVNVQTPADPGKGSVSYALNVNTTKIDTLVDDAHNDSVGTNYNVTVDVTELIGGIANATLKDGSTIANGETTATKVQSIRYKVEDKDGNVKYDDITKVDNVTNAAINVDVKQQLTVETVTFSGKSAKKNFGAGTYKVTVVITTKKGSDDPVSSTFTTNFEIVDTQPTGDVSLVEDTVTNGTIQAMAQKAFKYVYEGTSYAAANADKTLIISSVEGITSKGVKIDSENFDSETLSAGDKVNVSKITVEVVTGDSNYTVKIDVPVSLTITAK